jgi:tetratricopeptide (TPR) repeat protein
LDGVGGRVLAYYHNQPIADLSDAALTQRSQALSLMASVATQRGKTDNALRLYREAMVGTGEAMRRSPSDPQPIFDHAQNVFYVGEIAHERNDFPAAEANMREYQRLALRMVALQPDSMKFRMEKVYADFNLGVVLSDERQFPEAVAQFKESLRTMEAIATADPGNTDYQENLAESLTWLSDAQYALGDYRSAIAARERDIAIIERLFRRTGDINYERRLIPSHRALGVYYREQGQGDAAMMQFRTAVSIAEALIPKEQTNAVWLEQGYRSKFALGEQLLLSGNTAEAAAQTQGACQIVSTLLKRDSRNPEWRLGATRCWDLQARIALASGSKEQALKLAQTAVETSKAVPGKDVAANAYAAAGAYRLVGDIQRDLGDATGAQAAWAAAFARLPRERFEEPAHMAEHATILARVGRSGEAQLLRTRLQKIGYRMNIGE